MHLIDPGLPFAVLSSRRTPDGVTWLQHVIDAGEFAMIPEKVTAEQLAAVRAKDTKTRCNFNKSALHNVAEVGALLLVKNGVTAEQLMRVLDQEGRSTLHCAIHGALGSRWTRADVKVKCSNAKDYPHELDHKCHIEQIAGGVTATQLASVSLRNGYTALHAAAAANVIDKVKGGVTVKDLMMATTTWGSTALHSANECLDQIVGGVTAVQLLDARDKWGETAFNCAASAGTMRHITGGFTLPQLLLKYGKRTGFQCCLACWQDNATLDTEQSFDIEKTLRALQSDGLKLSANEPTSQQLSQMLAEFAKLLADTERDKPKPPTFGEQVTVELFELFRALWQSAEHQLRITKIVWHGQVSLFATTDQNQEWHYDLSEGDLI